MRFFINVLTTYFPDTDPPYDVYYRQILEQVSGDARRLGDPIMKLSVAGTPMNSNFGASNSTPGQAEHLLKR